MSILRKGLKGAPVKRLQERLGIAADGDFGSGTEAAVRTFQQDNGLSVDGIAGPDTFTAMGLYELILLRVGSVGAAVKNLQKGLNISADGIFGGGTEAAVKEFQQANDLSVDGVAGPNTLAKLDTFSEITDETVRKSHITKDEEHFEAEPLPNLDGASVTPDADAPVPQPEEKSVWGKVKGWFN